jgi:hypothetical protein
MALGRGATYPMAQLAQDEESGLRCGEEGGSRGHLSRGHIRTASTRLDARPTLKVIDQSNHRSEQSQPVSASPCDAF